jgi:hypothetical protein
MKRRQPLRNTRTITVSKVPCWEVCYVWWYLGIEFREAQGIGPMPTSVLCCSSGQNNTTRVDIRVLQNLGSTIECRQFESVPSNS